MNYCYLIHFTKPIGNSANSRGQAQHYLGYTAKGIQARLAEHQSGQGAKITRAAVLQGTELILARTWPPGTRELERLLKRRHSPKSFCPLCSPRLSQPS